MKHKEPISHDNEAGSDPGPDRTVSRVEVTGFEARHYDGLMNLVTAGTYPFFIRRVVRDMEILPDDGILIFGTGTGRNACLMTRYLSGRGRILGLDIGDEMLQKALHRCRHLPSVTFAKQRIEEQLPFQQEFEKVFISFVLHGFVQEDRLRIIDNAYRALRPGGTFVILDYGEFSLSQSAWPVRFLFEHIECPLAADYAGRDWKAILAEKGFGDFKAHFYYRDYVRLLVAKKQ